MLRQMGHVVSTFLQSIVKRYSRKQGSLYLRINTILGLFRIRRCNWICIGTLFSVDYRNHYSYNYNEFILLLFIEHLNLYFIYIKFIVYIL